MYKKYNKKMPNIQYLFKANKNYTKKLPNIKHT